MNQILTLLALVGITLIVVRGTILRRVRKIWPTFLGCSQCVGTWVGCAAGATGLITIGRPILDAIVAGAVTSLLAMFADAVLLHLLGDPEKP